MLKWTQNACTQTQRCVYKCSRLTPLKSSLWFQWNIHFKYLGISQWARTEPRGVEAIALVIQLLVKFLKISPPFFHKLESSWVFRGTPLWRRCWLQPAADQESSKCLTKACYLWGCKMFDFSHLYISILDTIQVSNYWCFQNSSSNGTGVTKTPATMVPFFLAAIKVGKIPRILARDWLYPLSSFTLARQQELLIQALLLPP